MILGKANITSYKYHPGYDSSTSFSSPPASPTRSSVVMDMHFEQEFYYIDVREGRPQVELMDNFEVTITLNFTFSTRGGNDRVPGPGNCTCNSTLPNNGTAPNNSTLTNNATSPDDKPALNNLTENYTWHFLTNCQWNNDKAQKCSKPWDFEKYTPESNPSTSSPFLLKRDANTSRLTNKSKEKMEKVRKNRRGCSIVHLIGCVFVGLSLLCTAASFFILPAFGKWISVGNLALATLATIFLLTSSIFTAVLAKKTTDFFDKDKDDKWGFKADSGTKFQALV